MSGSVFHLKSLKYSCVSLEWVDGMTDHILQQLYEFYTPHGQAGYRSQLLESSRSSTWRPHRQAGQSSTKLNEHMKDDARVCQWSLGNRSKSNILQCSVTQNSVHYTPPATPPDTPPATHPATPPATPPDTPPATPPATPPDTPPAIPPANPSATPPANPPANQKKHASNVVESIGLEWEKKRQGGFSPTLMISG